MKKKQERQKQIATDYENAKSDYAEAMLQNVSHECGVLVRDKHAVFLRLAAEQKHMIKQAKEIRPLTSTVKAVKYILSDVRAFMKANMGPRERIIERLITEPPINCKHNPYYAGAFNGNDCIRLVKNMSFILNSLQEQFESDETLTSLTACFYEIWTLWQSILPII